MSLTSRRTFTFASLAVAAGVTNARAATPEAQQASPPAGPALAGRWAVERSERALTVTLTVTNLGADELQILTKRGSRPAPQVQAVLEVDGGPIALAEIVEADRRELMSRMGPMPQWQALARGAALELGPWRFELPKGAQDEPVSFVAQVWAGDGPIELRSAVVPAGEKVAV